MARIAFVQNLVFEYLGLMYLSSMLKRYGHSIEVFIVRGNGNKELKEIVSYAPDLIGFSCTTGIHNWALNYAARLKEYCDARIIFGGPHPTYFPEIINEKPVDIICRGEGEYAILDLANKIDAGEDLTDTSNCWFRMGEEIRKNGQRLLINNLDEIPFPDRELYIKKYRYLNKTQKNFLAGRGCPFDCTFCFNHAFMDLYKGKGKMVRYRSVANLIEEIKDVKDRFRVNTVYMQDDTFILDKSWIREFTMRYKNEVGIPFICLIRADLADEDIIRQLSEASCKNVFFGVETGSEELRNLLVKKRISNLQIKNTAALLKKHNIRFRTYNMFGLPDENMEDAIKTVRLNIEIKTDYPWCSIFYPYPGTELAHYAREKGLLNREDYMVNPSFFKESVIDINHRRELENLQKLFFYAVKFPRALPLVLKLIRFKPNVIFDFAFLISYGWCYMKSENISLKEMVSIGMSNLKSFFFSKQ